MSEPNKREPTDRDYTAALRVLRAFIGSEPYAPAVSPMARALADERERLTAELLAPFVDALATMRRTAASQDPMGVAARLAYRDCGDLLADAICRAKEG